MKGVIASIAPTASVIDITHYITPFELLEGGFTVLQAYTAFAKKTIHVAIVDPGVGSARRPILVEAAGQYFIGPDNGLFTLLYHEQPKHKVRAITNTKYFLKDVSATFHGRDVFAPCAAHLAAGKLASTFGPLIHDYTRATGIFATRTGKRAWTGQVLKTDHFGNLITNLHIREFEEIVSRPFELLVGSVVVNKFAVNYQECGFGEPFAIIGSSGFIEVSVSQANAAKQLGCGAGAPVELTLG